VHICPEAHTHAISECPTAYRVAHKEEERECKKKKKLVIGKSGMMLTFLECS
jgi:hypothetical protein